MGKGTASTTIKIKKYDTEPDYSLVVIVMKI